MRVVSLNLDCDDAQVMRRALVVALSVCPCWQPAAGRVCGECEAIAVLVAELDRLLDRRRLDRGDAAVLDQAVMAVAGCPDAVARPGNRQPEGGGRLRVMEGGLAKVK